MDLRKNPRSDQTLNLLSSNDTIGSELVDEEKSLTEQTVADSTDESIFSGPVVEEAPPSAITLLNAFSAELAGVLRARDREAIRELVAARTAELLRVEIAHVFLSMSETVESSVLSVFETGVNRILNRMQGDAECVVAVRGRKDVLAVIRLGDKRDWSPFTMEDLSILDAISTQVALVLENLSLENELERHQRSSIQALAAAIEVKDRYTSGHTKRVGVYADALAEHLPVIETEKEKIRLAGVLHDIGKIGVPDRILLKPASLTGLEWEEMRLHTEAGFDIVSRVAGLEEIAEILRHHHERWNGTGYPRGLKEEDIPFASRVIAVADTFDAIVTDRPYRAAMSPETAREIITGLSGIHFDPAVVQAFIAAFPKLRECALNPDQD